MTIADHPLAEYLTISEIADRLGVTGRTVQRWIAAGRLPYRRIGSRVKVHPAWLHHVDTGNHEPVAMAQTATAGTDPSTNPGPSGSEYSRGNSR